MKKSNILCLFLLYWTVGYGQYKAPDLLCVQKAGNFITLTWRPPVEPCGSFIKYYIYYAPASGGAFQLLDSVSSYSTTTYIHNGIGSNQEFCYYMVSSYNCAGVSLTSDTLCSPRIPKPVLESISIENGHPVYLWSALSTNKNVWGYPIFYPGGRIIDTVVGREQNTYTDLFFDVMSGVYTGAVAAMDSCGGVNGRSNFDAHRPCFLSLVNNPCSDEIQFSWTKYQGWSSTDDVKEYEVWVKKNSDPEIKVGTNPTNILDFRYNDFKYGDTLCIRVKAIHPTKSGIYSYSNQFCFVSSKSQKPRVLQTLSASYIDNYAIRLRWYCSPDAIPKAFDLVKINPKNGIKLSTQEKINFVHEGNGFYSFLDKNGDYSRQVSYQMVFQDLCNNKSDGDEGYSNFIAVTQTGLYKNDIAWPKRFFPSTLPYTIRKYELYFSPDMVSFQKIADPLVSESSFSHDVENLFQSDGKFCYKLLVYYSLDTTKPLTDSVFTMYSQSACVLMRTVLWMPNAFKINGVTPTFKPKMYFFSSVVFRMKIFNRWGRQIFETNDPNTGWNGIMENGELASEDSYIYHITYLGNDGKSIEKTGNFILLR